MFVRSVGLRLKMNLSVSLTVFAFPLCCGLVLVLFQLFLMQTVKDETKYIYNNKEKKVGGKDPKENTGT